MKASLRICLAGAAAIVGAVLAIVAVFIGGYYYVEPGLPLAEQLRDVKLQTPLRVSSRDGRLLDQFGEQKRTPVPLEEIPEILINAVLAAEDHTFFEHPGLDWAGTVKAAFNFVRAGGESGERVAGGSTITQQVAGDYFTGRDYTLARKFKEVILALRIERQFTKEEILELFFNKTFFGQRSFGVVAAAQTYFNKELDELTLSDAAILAGIPQGPSIMNPFNSPDNAARRRAYVLRRLLELGEITDTVYEETLAVPILATRYGPQIEVDAPYVAEMVRAEMIRRFGDAAQTAGLKVTTTIDSRLQAAANGAERETLISYDERHGYRGPIARIQLPNQSEYIESRWADLLADYADPDGFETALVLGVDETEALIYLRGRGYQTVGLESMDWAARYINDDLKGARPSAVDEVLSSGNIVHFRRNDDGTLRLGQLPDVQGAFVALDPTDGAIVSLVGGFDYYLSKYNRATQSRRQPGSAFKPFVYSAALENGFTPATLVNDAPITIYDPVLEREWKPENYGRRFHGEVPLREALVESYNAASIRVMRSVGVGTTVRHVRRFGFNEDAIRRDLSLALGTGGIAPLDLATGYAVLANGGYRVSPYLIERVEDADGNVLYPLYATAAMVPCTQAVTWPGQDAWQYETLMDASAAVCDEEFEESSDSNTNAEPEELLSLPALYPEIRPAPRAISAQNAYLVTDMMRDVIRHGTGNRAQRELRRGDLAGKTGTTDDRRDAWFAGFNADIVGAAWVGFNEDRPLGGNEQGGVTAIPMWISFMAEALDALPERSMQRPPGIIERRINPESGLLASDANPATVFEMFMIGHEPERELDSSFSTPLADVPADEQGSIGERIF